MAKIKTAIERIECALKRLNEKMESHVIILNVVHLTHTEEINRILIRLPEVEDLPDKLPAVHDEKNK